MKHKMIHALTGVDLLASRKYAVSSTWASVSPYAGVSTYLSSSHETTSAVNLSDENVLGVQGMVGAVIQVSKARLGVEYNLAKVRSTSLKVGVSFYLHKNSELETQETGHACEAETNTLLHLHPELVKKESWAGSLSGRLSGTGPWLVSRRALGAESGNRVIGSSRCAPSFAPEARST